MKQSLILLLLLALIGQVKYQSVELSTLVNYSTEKRFDRAAGVGMLYSHKVSSNGALGFSFCYKQKHSEYDKIEWLAYPPYAYAFYKMNSDSKSTSFRVNYQYSVINREQVELSLAPEISYNTLWGNDNNSIYLAPSTETSFHNMGIEENETIKKWGIGALARLQIHQIFTPKLSLCFDIRLENLYSGSYAGGEIPYSGIITNTEFLVGLSYQLK